MVADRSVRLRPLTVTTPSDSTANIVGSAVDVNTNCVQMLGSVTWNVWEALAAV
jgi:hypothetical protein